MRWQSVTPYDFVVTVGDSPIGPAWAAAVTSGRPTYAGATQRPGPGGIGTQPSGTTTASPTAATTTAAQIATTRRVGRSHARVFHHSSGRAATTSTSGPNRNHSSPTPTRANVRANLISARS